MTDANSVTVTNTYDSLGRLSTRTAPDGGVERFSYTARGLSVYTNQLNFGTYFVYDEAGRKLVQQTANLETILYTNNAAGDLLSLTDGKNQTTRWNYDEYGRVTNKLDQAGVEILRYKYDPDGRLTNRWSAVKGDTRYQYDPVGNLTNVDYAISTDLNFAYDALNRVTTMVDAVGTTTYGYTAAGQPLTEDGPFADDTVTNGYSNRLRTSLSLAQSVGIWTNGFGYDAAKRLTNVTSQAGSFAYALGGASYASPLIKKLSLPNTSYTTNTYDSMARLTGTWLNKNDHTTLDAATYGYTGNQRTAHTNAPGAFVSYTYDNIGQLKTADSITNAEDRGYLYDAAWNLNYRTNNGVLSTFIVDPKNQLTNALNAALSYDGNGNLTNADDGHYAYAYDDENRLVQWFYYQTGTPGNDGDLATAFSYDGLGRLRQRIEFTFSGGLGDWVPTNQVNYIYDGWRVIQERDGDNTPVVSYTRGDDLSGTLEGAGGIGGLLARSHDYASTNGNWYMHNFYHADGNGNITYVVDTSQTLAASYRYDPFGNTISQGGSLASANVYRFSSKGFYDQTGGLPMYYFGYRWYLPNLQRWPSRDPIAENGDLNLYGYAANDPIRSIDPLGHDSVTLPEGTPGPSGYRKCGQIGKQILWCKDDPKAKKWRPPPTEPLPTICPKKPEDPGDCWASLPSDKLIKVPLIGAAKPAALEAMLTGCLACCVDNFNSKGNKFNQCVANCDGKYFAAGGRSTTHPGPRF